MIDRLISTSSTDLLERTLNFTEQRHQLILDNIANVSTPGYVQKDVSVKDFQQSMQDALERQQASTNGQGEPESTESIQFVPGSTGVNVKPQDVVRQTAFHDRGIRNMEDLMGQLGDNAMVHNTVAQFLKDRYNQINRAISMKV